MTSRDRSRAQAISSGHTLPISREDDALHAPGVAPRVAGHRPYDEPAYADETGPVVTAPRRRGPPLKVIFGIGLLLILLVTVVGGSLLWQRVSAFNASVSSAPATSSALFGPLGGEERVNIALFGYGGEEHKGGNFLADSIQVVSIDPAADTTTVIPIPRDLWIEGLPELPDNGKINAAFAVGHQEGGVEEGARLTTEILSRVTGLEIAHWMAIDFAGFRELVDQVGGITVNNPRAFRYTWSERTFEKGKFSAGRFRKGEIHLNGQQALDYARARYTSLPRESSDFARSVRQQRVLEALRAKLGGGGFGSIGPGLGMMDALEGRMRTDLSAIDLLLLSDDLDPDARIELEEGRVLEATTNTLGEYILVVIGRADAADYGPLRDYLARELAKPVPTSSGAPSTGP